MELLRAMLGAGVRGPIGYQINGLRRDVCARGSYSFQPVGTKAKTRKVLFGADWDGQLIFAGEACSNEHPGTVHGALMTGRVAAEMAGK
jgi:monoamine oxidase